MPVITGTIGNDVLNGTADADDIKALDGDDNVRGGAGDDEIDGGAGNDNLGGQEGDDIIYGGAGNDYLGEYYTQEFVGGSDRLYGESGDDRIVYYSPARTDNAFAVLDGGIGEDILEFQGGSSFQFPNLVGNNSGELIGGAGNDRILTSGGGAVTIDAGSGDDLIRLSQWGTDYEITLGAGSDLLLATSELAIGVPAILVTDFAAGNAGDVLGLGSFLDRRFSLDADDNPFTSGSLRLVQRGADAVLQANGISNSGFVDFIILRNVVASTLTAHNLSGYAQDGSAAPVVTFVGTAAADNYSGNSGNDYLQGLDGADWLYGGAGDDRIEGGAGNDMLTGEEGDDLIFGGAGNDELISELGVDQLFGEAGNDGILVDLSASWTGSGTIIMDGGDDDDFIRFTDQWDSGSATIIGGAGNDSISFNGGRSISIDAGSGNDYVSVELFRTDAFVRLGTGSDQLGLLGGSATTSANTLTVADFTTGGSGDTMVFYFLYGIVSDWDPAINPFATNYLRLAQSGDDTLLLLNARGEGQFFNLVGRFTDVTASQLTQFNLGYAPGQIAIAGGDGADVLSGTASADQLFGLDGNDILSGGGGNDRLAGGLGNDIYYVDGGDLVFEGAGEGRDVVYSSMSYQLDRAARIEVLATSSEAGTSAIALVGSDFENLLIGNAGANRLNGAAGEDSLFGLAGNDELIGGTGVDAMDGGAGDDSYYVDSAYDRVTERAGQGRDIVYASASYRLADGMEIEVLATASEGGMNAVNLVGNGIANLLIGNAGANRLNGGMGDDSLVGLAGDDELIGGGGIDAMDGGRGNDSYYVDGLYDRVTERSGEGRDIIYASTSYRLAEGMEIEVLATASETGTEPINLVANGLDNFVLGNAGANRLNGGGGDDVLIGLAGSDELIGGVGTDSMAGGQGDDAYYVDTLADKVIELAGEGRDVVYASVSYRLAESAEVETLATTSQGGADAIDLHGNGLANFIIGNAGANILDGGSGADTLAGLGGADRFSFTSVLRAGNVDTIVDFQAGIDRIVLDDAVFSGLGIGVLQAGVFRTGAGAADADDRIIYDAQSGALYFDPDGTGGAAAIQFATLSSTPTLAASDIFVA